MLPAGFTGDAATGETGSGFPIDGRLPQGIALGYSHDSRLSEIAKDNTSFS